MYTWLSESEKNFCDKVMKEGEILHESIKVIFGIKSEMYEIEFNSKIYIIKREDGEWVHLFLG